MIITRMLSMPMFMLSLLNPNVRGKWEDSTVLEELRGNQT